MLAQPARTKCANEGRWPRICNERR